MNGEVKCITCKFAELTPESGTNGEGICHARPPTTVMVGTPSGPKVMIMQALVKLTRDWCSFHEVQLVKPVSGLGSEAPMPWRGDMLGKRK